MLLDNSLRLEVPEHVDHNSIWKTRGFGFRVWGFGNSLWKTAQG